MAMKQTQTKLFDFSDVGLDFCAGSKNLFPDRFKKMLSSGYNTQTVASVAVAGNQVTLTYGVSHGYAADRVLKIESGVLAGINGGEFWIDSVTTNTLTFTLDDAPVSIAGAFITKIASLGWELVFEQPYIHLYKMKYLDGRDLYTRLVFQNTAAYRNRVGVCIGKTADTTLGTITDEATSTEHATATTPNGVFAWDYSYYANATHNSYTYSQGLSTFGKGVVIGSLYHVIFMNHYYNTTPYCSNLSAILPAKCIDYSSLDYPLLIGCSYGNPTSAGYSNSYLNGNYAAAQIGNLRVCFVESTSPAPPLFTTPAAVSSYLPSSLDTFNTTVAKPLNLYIYGNGQFIGCTEGGLYSAAYASGVVSDSTITNYPKLSADIDFNSKCYLHHLFGSSNSSYIGIVAPIEEIKIV